MKKRLLAVLLVAIVFVGSGVAFSYWDNLQQTQNETINIGEGVSLTVSANATAPAGKFLVPSGAIVKANDVTSVELTYDVVLDQTLASALNLSVSSSNVLIGGDATYANLVGISISPTSTTVNDTNVLVTITVTLSEPADVTAYNAVINQPITFDLTFTATEA